MMDVARRTGVSDETLVDLLQRHASQAPERVAYTFLSYRGDGPPDASTLTYRELDRRARAIAAALEEAGAADQRVLLVDPPGLDYVAAFFGCLYAGAVAVPAYPPDPAHPERNLGRLVGILDDARPTVALAQRAVILAARALAARVPAAAALRWIATDQLDLERAAAWAARAPSGEALAFLQYTSGSTGSPRGVMIRHHNLIENLSQVERRFELSADSVIVSWLPPYHDMGLIGAILQVTELGCRGILMSPVSFLQRPIRWLQAISDHRGTTSYAPNFAFELCLRRIGDEQRRSLDLSSWSVAGNAAEPVRADTIRRFTDAFASAGFRPDAMKPGYGLAEATLVVSADPPRAGVRTLRCDRDALAAGRVAPAEREGRSQVLVGCGTPLDDQQLVIASLLDRRRCGPGEIGEIWLAGPSIADGYWGRPAESEETFGARLATGEGPFLRTGDLGFLDAEGQLVIAGRLKDLVIIRGRNHYPQDIERTVETAHPRVRPGCAAAFSVDRADEERLVAVAEIASETGGDPAAGELTAGELAGIVESVRCAILSEHEVAPHAIVLLPQGRLPKTSSGKVQRRACREQLEAGSLAPLASWTDPGERVGAAGGSADHAPGGAEAEEADAALLAAELVQASGRRASEIDLDRPLGWHGVDSLQTVELAVGIERRFGVPVTSAELTAAPSLRAIARTLADRRRAGQVADALPLVVPAPHDRHRPFPLTDVQAAYLLGRDPAFELGNVACQTYVEVAVRGVDLDRLERAIRRLVEHHDMLRAVITADGQQTVLERVPAYQIRTLDLRGRPPAAIEAELAAVRAEMSHRIRPAVEWPLFEVRASRIDPEWTHLHIGADLLICDASSLALLARECVRLYREPAGALPVIEVTFRDYVLAEARLRDSERHRAAQAYWKGRLSSLPPAPELPLAASPRKVATPRFVRRTAELAAERWRRLEDQGRQAGLTPSALLAAAFSEVLATWSAQPRFTLNLTTFQRLPLHPQLDQVVGDFTSLLLLEVDASASAPFRARAERLQRALWEALDHRAMSGVEVMRELARASGDPTAAAMPVVLTSLLGLGRLPALDGGAARLVCGVSQTPQVLLDHQVWERADGGLAWSWDAVEALFPAGMLDQMFAAYHRLLESLADQPGRWDARSRCLVPADALAARDRVNATAAPIPDGTLYTQVVAAAAAHPDAVAVIAGDRTLTYPELLAEANRIGRWLRERGAAPERLVAVVMEKGWEQVVAVLGILAAGAAYLPIDPALPGERLRFLLENAAVELALTQSGPDRAIAWPAGVRRLVVDRGLPLELDGSPLAPAQGPHDLAYVIYTSGTTGLPKGVMIEHRAALNTIADINRQFRVTAADRVLALSSLSFDLSVYDLFGPLLAGAAIVVPDATRERDPAHWAELIAARQVTIWNSVPALMQLLVAEHAHRSAGLPASLRLVLLSGDWIPTTLPDRLRAAAGARALEIIGLGGATEASIWSIAYRIEEVDPAWPSIPYGTPLANQRFHVLDQDLAPCPVWVPGDLYIGGDGLARGYLRDEERTRERFITHPATGERLYRTGDRGRYLPDGVIEFLGRTDLQVKLNGLRVELGEIEAALLQHPSVSGAVVAMLGGRHESKRLVAYVTGHRGASAPAPDELRAHLAARLPAAMVPLAYTVLDAFPTTANGKIDRAALSAAAAKAPGRPEPVPPADATERALAAAWEKVLAIPAVGRGDQFFALGGDSMSALQVVCELGRTTPELRVTVRQLFQHPVLADLAREVARVAASGEAAAAARLPEQPAAVPADPVPDGCHDVYPITRMQEVIIREYRMNRGGAGNYHNQLVLRFSHPSFSVHLFERALSALIDRHPGLRTTFATGSDGRLRQVVWSRRAVPLEVRDDLVGLSAEDQERVLAGAMLEDRARPFDVANPQAPLFRYRVFRSSPHEWRILFSHHHAILDGWSNWAAFKELFELYERLERGDVGPLGKTVDSCKEYVALERNVTASDTMRRFWRGQLEGAAGPLLEPRGDAAGDPRDAMARLVLPEATSAAIREAAREMAVTPKAIYLGELFRLLAGELGTDDVTVGSIANGRTAALSDPLGAIGLFWNVVPLRCRAAGGEPGAVARSAQDVLVAAEPHAAYPFQQLLADLGRDQLFSACLNFVHFHHFKLTADTPFRSLDVHAYDKYHFPLYFMVSDNPLDRRVTLQTYYDRAYLDRDRWQRWTGRYVELLRGWER